MPEDGDRRVLEGFPQFSLTGGGYAVTISDVRMSDRLQRDTLDSNSLKLITVFRNTLFLPRFRNEHLVPRQVARRSVVSRVLPLGSALFASPRLNRDSPRSSSYGKEQEEQNARPNRRSC